MARIVIVMMDGGLGNQISQFVFVRLIEKLYGVSCIIDDSAFWKEAGVVDHNGYELENIFGIKLNFLSSVFEPEVWHNMLINKKNGISIPSQLSQLGMDFKFVSEIDVPADYVNQKVIRMDSDSSDVFNFLGALEGNLYFHGYYINSKYWKVKKESIKNELVFPALVDGMSNYENNKMYYDRINNSNSVALHIRRGDFVNLGRAISANEYKKIICEIEKQNDDAVYFVFSDDLDWCRNNKSELGIDLVESRVVFVEGNDVPGHQYIDMQLMSSCKQMVLCDSSFSYWAALLNENADLKLYRVYEKEKVESTKKEYLKRFSIVMPCYNVENYISECLDSILNQTIDLSEIEIVVIDDCSTDGTIDILKQYEEKYPELFVLILLEQNGKQGTARNIGMQYISGEYVTFIDADDLVRNDMFEILSALIDKYSMDVVQFRYKMFHDGETPDQGNVNIDELLESDKCKYYLYGQNRKEYLLNSGIINESCKKLYRSNLIKQYGITFSEGVTYEEPKFTHPMKYVVETAVVLEEQIYFYRENRQGTTVMYMNRPGTIMEHVSAQLNLRIFMENFPPVSGYEQEAEVYFLHSFLLEPLFFMRKRGWPVPLNLFKYLKEQVIIHVPAYKENVYINRAGMEDVKMLLDFFEVFDSKAGNDNELQKLLDDVVDKLQEN